METVKNTFLRFILIICTALCIFLDVNAMKRSIDDVIGSADAEQQLSKKRALEQNSSSNNSSTSSNTTTNVTSVTTQPVAQQLNPSLTINAPNVTTATTCKPADDNDDVYTGSSLQNSSSSSSSSSSRSTTTHQSIQQYLTLTIRNITPKTLTVWLQDSDKYKIFPNSYKDFKKEYGEDLIISYYDSSSKSRKDVSWSTKDEIASIDNQTNTHELIFSRRGINWEPKDNLDKTYVQPILPIRLVFCNTTAHDIEVLINYGNPQSSISQQTSYSGLLKQNSRVILLKFPGDPITISARYANNEKEKFSYNPSFYTNTNDIDKQTDTHNFVFSDKEIKWQARQISSIATPQSQISMQEIYTLKQESPVFFDKLNDQCQASMAWFLKQNKDNAKLKDKLLTIQTKQIKSFEEIYNENFQNKEEREFVRKLRLIAIGETYKNNDTIKQYAHFIFDDTNELKSWVLFDINFLKRGISNPTNFSLPPFEPLYRDHISKLNLNDPDIAKNPLIRAWGCCLYKIHLMPYDEEIETITIRLLEEIKKDPEFKKAICGFKVYGALHNSHVGQNEVVPKIVIYAKPRKASAQLILNKLYVAFKDMEGTGQAPRFNKKITSLLYWAQGDGVDKTIQVNQKYFDQPDMVCYRPDIKRSTNPQAPLEDYYLINPAPESSSNNNDSDSSSASTQELSSDDDDNNNNNDNDDVDEKPTASSSSSSSSSSNNI